MLIYRNSEPQMLPNPDTKYQPFQSIKLKNRQWPNNNISAPPIWMSTDLRDGNQALIDPMSIQTNTIPS